MKFILLTHERELTKGTNTGRLVKQVLADSADVIVWKRKEPNQRLVSLLEAKQAALVYPDAESARNNIGLQLSKYQYFVLIDSTWQEARKIFNRSDYLKQADKVSLSISKPSEFKLRRNQIEGGLSTAECVIEILRYSGATKNIQDLEEMFHIFNKP